MATTTKELAEKVVRTLEAQRRYFDCGRDAADLAYSKRLERDLLAAARAILAERPVQVGLFDGEGG
jgi:hypothetical protein